jgi:hypothetical protein
MGRVTFRGWYGGRFAGFQDEMGSRRMKWTVLRLEERAMMGVFKVCPSFRLLAEDGANIRTCAFQQIVLSVNEYNTGN